MFGYIKQDIDLSNNSEKIKSIQMDIKFDIDMKMTEDLTNNYLKQYINNSSCSKPILKIRYYGEMEDD